MDINTAIKLQDKFTATMKKITDSSDKASKSFATVNVNVKKIDSGMKTGTSSAGSFLKGMLAFSAIQGVFSMITSQLDGAISRFDTMNNYPKVLKNLGFGAEESQASIDKLSERLKGIPTRLDEAASGVQRLVAANGDVESSTEMWLAMNDAVLAGGASQQLQQAALEQLTQAYAKGKPDMAEWKTLQQAMPGQLKQVATAMGYADGNVQTLYKDIQRGTVSMNDFMATIYQLDHEGLDGLADFHQQALDASDGIQTAIANMQSAIQRGWTKMLEGANQALDASGLPTIQEMITNIGKGLEDTMGRIGSDILPTLVEAFSEIHYAISDVMAVVTDYADVSEDSSERALDGWDYLALGIQVLSLGIDAAFTGLMVTALTLKMILQAAFLAIYVAFHALYTGFMGVVTGIVLLFQGFVNTIIGFINILIDGFNGLSEGLNNLSGGTINLGKSEHVQQATFGNDFYNDFAAGVEDRNKFIGDIAGDITDTAGKIAQISEDAGQRWQAKSQNIALDIQNRKKPKEASQKAEEENKDLTDKIKGLSNGVKDVTGTDSSGNKAIKTTTDDNLLKDEDIQLLLDVATRDYKLNYQSVTPNITLTFGDVRETADVDDILDKVADRLEEIYDGNLEVARV